MSDFPIIGIVGKQASGKTVAASELEKKGAERVHMGDIVWNELEERELEVSEKNVGRIANELREEEGMDAIAKKSIPIIRKKGKDGKFIVVDGIRGIEEIERFRKEFDENFFLIAIKASDETRYNRIKNRGREDDIDNFEEFREKEKREMNWGLEEAIESADFQILNEDSIEDLEKSISNIYEEIIHENCYRSANISE